MSMTDVEIATNAGRTILCSLEADGRLHFLSQSQRDVAVMMQDFFANRVLELKAAEKLQEPERRVLTSERLQQLDNWCTALDVESTVSRRCQEQMSKRLAALERQGETLGNG